ncbi:MAG: PKD domain-containing protein [Candidatus Cloacimonetes bacterium]|nr:PKD domain-containing protein [Candidatus Cloacimonadota bacterium]MCF7813669.1 PKD domain-containing protein [Candidatus Cloacimonadota bacterium]MCF7867175.1 PKD domain-containing protein [Candidatus Cloacimonadota bacterium]MCF7882505.1 PKD domain-containing protein [Candidatus Cloacimonadota bacterium]
MKRTYFLLTILMISTFIFSDVEFTSTNDKVTLSYQKERGQQQEARLDKLLAIPSENAEVVVTNCEVEVYDADGKLIETKRISGQNFARITESFIMRDLYGHQLQIDLEKKEGDTVTRIKNIDLEVQAVNRTEIPQKISKAFLPVYREIVDNFDGSYLRNLEVQESKMLIVAHSDLLQTVQFFTAWKNAKGIDTEVILKEDAGTTNAEIKNYISDIYQTEEFPPDYLVIIGDINGPFAVPSFFINSGTEDDVTDHPYTLMEGDDYFPEMIVGRMSVDSNNELQTIVSKVYNYEKTPYMGNTDWFEKALLVAGNFSDSPPPPTTPVKVTMWLRDKMYDYGYDEITELYYWPPNYNVYPGTSQIISAINDGVGIVTYRGWGDANGWHYPRFHVDDMNGVSNGYYLPVVTSIVCNTGDFANANADPCFGENWLTMGSPSSPAGGVVFVGPSDLHTRTKYNNAIFAGFYQGLLDEEIHSFGSAVLRGKYELWANYPFNRESGDYVEFYYNVYNILGDPSIDVWTKVPQQINISLPDEISLGTNYLEVNAADLEGAVITAIKDDEVFAVENIVAGSALLYFNMQTTGNLTVTVTKPNYHPLIQEIEVVNQNIDIGFEEFTTSGPAVAGQNIDLNISLHNFGSQAASGVTATLSTLNSNVNIISDTADYGDITSGSSVIGDFEIAILPNCPDNTVIEFDLAISTGSTAKFELVVSSLSLEAGEVIVMDDNGILEPNETSDLSVEITNAGSFDVNSLNLELVSLVSDAVITSANATINSLTMNSSEEVTFTVELSETCYVGKNLPFRIDVIDADDQETSVFFNLEAGIVINTAPTGPDEYGYYAYDSRDLIYTEAPEYEWIEIDPLEGGAGEVEELGDDRSFTIPMPFDFPYYGEVTDSITVCTNGWISMQPTWETYFRNWNIPSALGPYGGIYPFWDDLIGEEVEPELHADMRICYYNDAANNRFIVEWNKCVNRYDNVTPEKFQIVLYDPQYYPTSTGDGEIQFNYQMVGNVDFTNNFATIGIENFEQDGGLLLSYANQYPNSITVPEAQYSIKITTDSPDYIPLAVPNADFSTENPGGIYPLEVQFINETDLMFPANTYLWEFGDGESSTEINPTHIYEEIGSYDVSLTVTNSEGSNTELKEGFITVAAPEAPVVSFTADSFGGIVPVTVNFDNTTTPEGAVNEYLWYFGDGETSTDIEPVHTYETAGFYSVSLVATNDVGTDSVFVENFITVMDETVSIWPGDTDNNGIVEMSDILPIGIYWREHGDERQNINFSWAAQAYPEDWDIELAPFADCNGDGEVDIADVLGICLNWEMTHDGAMMNPPDPGNLELYRDNFTQIYSGLGNSGRELELKNFLAQQFDFPIVQPEISNLLKQNYPNPFNPTTNIAYDIQESGKVKISIFNIKGQLVRTLVNDTKPAGTHSVDWHGKDNAGRNVSSGLYFYRLSKENKIIDTKKMLLLK